MITIDLKDKRPLYLQIIDGIEDLTIKGVLAPNEQLPSVRSLAMELSINPNTIQRAYLELEKRGTTYSIQGKGSFINEDHQALEDAKKLDLFQELKALIQMAITLGIKQDEFLDVVRSFFTEPEEGERT